MKAIIYVRYIMATPFPTHTDTGPTHTGPGPCPHCWASFPLVSPEFIEVFRAVELSTARSQKASAAMIDMPKSAQ